MLKHLYLTNLTNNLIFLLKLIKTKMRKEFLFLVVVFLTQSFVISSARRCGRCADVPVDKDFNLERFQGTWYEIERFPNRFEAHLQCVKSEYEFTGNNTIYARNSGRYG